MTAAAENTEVTVEQNDAQAQAIIDALDPVKLAELVGKKGFVIKPETDYKADLAKADSEATKRNYTTIEQGIFEMTQVPKKEGEKVHEYQKRAFNESINKTKLEKEAVTAEVSEVASSQMEMIKALQKEVAESRERERLRESQSFEEKAWGMVDGAFSTIKLNVLDEADLSTEREERRALFEALYKPSKGENNTVLWKSKKNGEVLLDSNGLPMNPDGIIKKNHPKWLAKEGNQQTGLGLKGKTDKPALQYGSTRDEISGKISEEAKKRGVAVTSPEMIKLRKEAYAAAGFPS